MSLPSVSCHPRYYNTSSTPRASPPRINSTTSKRTRYKFRRDVSWRSPYMNGVKSKDKAARDLELAVKEARQWIQVGRVGGLGL